MPFFLVISFAVVNPSRFLPIICIGEGTEEELDAAEGVDEVTFRAEVWSNGRVLCCVLAADLFF